MRTKPKRDFLGGYKTYDPETEGYGDPADWRQAFKWRMGMDEAKQRVGSESPWVILGFDYALAFTADAWKTVKSAFRKLAMKFHPDHNPTGAEDFKKVYAAYTILETTYKAHGVDAR